MNEEVPKTITKTGIIDFLRKKGAGDLLNTQDVARLIKRNIQTVRRYAKSGELKSTKVIYNRAVYEIGDVADFVLTHPQIALWPRQVFEISEKNIELIRRIVFKNWGVFAREYGAEDLVSEVMVQIAKTPRTGSTTEELAVAIQRVIYKIYTKFKTEPKTVPLDENTEGAVNEE